jgi:branched-chain amino acid transport system substrate-binding protein
VKPVANALALLVLWAAGASAFAQEPHRGPGQEPLDFRGPGRDEPEPDVAEVLLGWFGPGEPAHPELGDFWRGATLALERENASGGYRGRPFRLLPAWSESPWKAGVLDVARLVQQQGAWAVLGGVDGTTTHLAVQLALKSHFLLLSPGSTDPTADAANVPWLFSLAPSDRAIVPLLAGVADRAGGRFAILAGNDHDSHATLVELRRALRDRPTGPTSVVEVRPEEDVGEAVARVLAGRPRALLVLAPAARGGQLVGALRAAGFDGTIAGGPPFGRAAFARAAGAGAEGVLAPRAGAGSGPAWDAFVRAYEARWGEPPDAAAVHGYDALRMAAEAVRRAGLNRARIRDAVRDLAPWDGASGTVRWDARGRNDGAVRLGRWRGGRLFPLD